MEKHHMNDYFANAELSEIFATMALRSLALSVIGIFIPIILLQQGYTFVEVMIYEGAMFSMTFVTFVFSQHIMNKIGVKHTMMLSIPFLIAFYYMIDSISTYQFNVILIAIMAGLTTGLYWFPFHIEFAKYTSEKKRGSQIGLLNAITLIVAVIGPVVGGTIITVWGNSAILYTSGAIMILSIIPLLFTKDEKVNLHISFSKTVGKLDNKLKFAFFCEGVRHSSAILFWPIFMFTQSVQVFTVGLIYTIVRLVNVCTTLIVGRMADKKSPKQMLKIGTFINGLTLSVRGFIGFATGALATITSVGGIGFIIMNNSFQKIWYKKAQGNAQFVMVREFYLELGRAFLAFSAVLIFGLILNIVGEVSTSIVYTSIYAFILGAICAIGMNMID